MAAAGRKEIRKLSSFEECSFHGSQWSAHEQFVFERDGRPGVDFATCRPGGDAALGRQVELSLHYASVRVRAHRFSASLPSSESVVDDMKFHPRSTGQVGRMHQRCLH